LFWLILFISNFVLSMSFVRPVKIILYIPALNWRGCPCKWALGLAQQIKPLLVALTHTYTLFSEPWAAAVNPSARVFVSAVTLSQEVSLLHVSALLVHASSLLSPFRNLQLRAFVNSVSGFVPPLSQPYSSSLKLLCSWSCHRGLC